MNPDTNVTYQTVYLVLTNVLSTSFLMFHITFNESAQHCLYSSVIKVDILDTCRAICLYFGIAFLLFFYKDKECCLHILPKQSTFVH